ncbi:hypothetical protein M153_15500016514 [Pseudoloma neurophilia]|uniref:Uncharacterized protein n=1 Tax=Pseudoloma neurophilia TaxID=146866 RepID=A0A0R0M581_9MICR|nr:hypothetical protein M153_15500016514 [Pseudoloma neurophilia]
MKRRYLLLFVILAIIVSFFIIILIAWKTVGIKQGFKELLNDDTKKKPTGIKVKK